MNARAFIESFLSLSKYAFTWEECLVHSGKSEVAARQMLNRLIQKNEIINLRQGFYLIFSPQYKFRQYLPCSLYVDKLFEYIEQSYYIALYSAASLHGANHQQVMDDFVITSLPKQRNIVKENFHIRFTSISQWPEKNILKRKTETGYFYVSSPALTSIDLIHHHTKLGGLNRVFNVLVELFEEISTNDLQDLLSWYPYKSSLQRLGYLLEAAEADKELIGLLKTDFYSKKYFPILLSPRSNERAGSTGNFWKVTLNVNLDLDI